MSDPTTPGLEGEMSDYYREIASLFRAREALMKQGAEGDYVHPVLRDIGLSIKAMRDADAESAHREYNPHEGGRVR